MPLVLSDPGRRAVSAAVVAAFAALCLVDRSVVALLGPHVAALDMTPEQFRTAPTWQPSADASEIGPDETIRVAITRR